MAFASPRRGDTYYDVLGLQLNATEEEIRRQYHAIVRTLHPDRRVAGAGDGLERFHQVQSAWRVLSDPMRRLLYDLRVFGRSSIEQSGILSDEAETRLIQLQKEQAQKDISNMQDLLSKVLALETAKNGVVIKRAFYGLLTLRADRIEDCIDGGRIIGVDDLEGPCVDVTIPVQCLVEKHSIMLPGGASQSKADLPGFYNPTPLERGTELSLYVMYEFKGKLHEVTVGDRETLRIPKRQHAVDIGALPRGPFCAANANLVQHSKQEAAKVQFNVVGGSKQALARAVLAYQYHWLRVQTGMPTPEELGAGEFLQVVCLGSSRLVEQLLGFLTQRRTIL